MRILLVIDSFGPGGAQRQINLLGRELSRRGHSVVYFVYYPQFDHFWPNDLRVHHFRKDSAYSIKPVLALRKLVRANAYDILLAYLSTPSVYAELARFGKKKPALIVSERFDFP